MGLIKFEYVENLLKLKLLVEEWFVVWEMGWNLIEWRFCVFRFY